MSWVRPCGYRQMTVRHRSLSGLVIVGAVGPAASLVPGVAMDWRVAAIFVSFLLSCWVAPGHSRRPDGPVQDSRLGGYLPRVGHRHVTGRRIGELVSLFSHFVEMRQLPSGRTIPIFSIFGPILHDKANKICQLHSDAYLKAIGKELWADAFFDATGKLPDGLLAGNLNAFGAWDECVNTEVALKQSDHPEIPPEYLNFTGRYVSTMFFPAGTRSEELDADEDDSLGGSIDVPTNGLGTGVHGVCAPSSCTTQDVQAGIQQRLGKLAYVAAFESYAKGDAVELSSSDKLVISLMAIVGFLIVAGTAIDMYNRGFLQQLATESRLKAGSDVTLLGSSEPRAKQECAPPVPARRIRLPPLEAFSLYSNTVKLLDTTPVKDTISCLHGIRFLSMAWVVIGHASSYVMYMNGNAMVVQDLVKTYLFAAVDNATVSVDTFFLLSGLLVSYGFFNVYEKTKRINIGSMYLHRYIRLSIPYAFMIAIAATWVLHIGDGPLWTSSNLGQAQACQKYWWRNLLYIQTFYHSSSSQMCIGQSWYLANDMQMFLFSPVVLLPLLWRPMWGLLWLAVVTAAFLALRIVIWSVKNLPPTLLIYQSNLDDPSSQDEFLFQYMLSWIRVTVWLTGIALGYLLHRVRGRKLNLKLWLVWPAWLVAVATGILVVYGMTSYQMPWQVPSKAVSVAYGGLHRFAWGLAVAWVIFACQTGYGGWVDALLSYPGFVPLSRLTYSGYLVHINVLQFSMWSAKGIIYYDSLRYTYWILSQIIVTFAVAYAFSMSFEAPFLRLEKLLRAPKRTEPAPTQEPAAKPASNAQTSAAAAAAAEPEKQS